MQATALLLVLTALLLAARFRDSYRIRLLAILLVVVPLSIQYLGVVLSPRLAVASAAGTAQHSPSREWLDGTYAVQSVIRSFVPLLSFSLLALVVIAAIPGRRTAP